MLNFILKMILKWSEKRSKKRPSFFCEFCNKSIEFKNYSSYSTNTDYNCNCPNCNNSNKFIFKDASDYFALGFTHGYKINSKLNLYRINTNNKKKYMYTVTIR